jgi:hypothetical protein
MDRRYELKGRGYTLDKLAQRVGEIYQIEREDLYSKSRQKIRAEARSVFCYWAVRELGVEGTQIAKKLQMSQPGVAYAVRGEGCESEGDSDDRVVIELQMDPNKRKNIISPLTQGSPLHVMLVIAPNVGCAISTSLYIL